MLDKIKGAVTHKIGPLPIWAYVIIGGGMVLFLRSRKPGDASAQFVAANPAGNARGGGGTVVDDPTPAIPPPSVKPPDAGGFIPLPIIIDDPTTRSPKAGQNKVTVGHSAADLAAEPAGGWVVPPIFQQVSPTKVIDTTGGKTAPGGQGVVNPGNVLIGYANPTTGALEPNPNGGPAIWR